MMKSTVLSLRADIDKNGNVDTKEMEQIVTVRAQGTSRASEFVVLICLGDLRSAGRGESQGREFAQQARGENHEQTRSERRSNIDQR